MRPIDADILVKTIEKAQMESLKVNVLSLIHDAPTIKPTTVYEFKGCANCELERPKGKWIERGNYVYCSNCNAQEDDAFANYCWSCGADMRGEEE